MAVKKYIKFDSVDGYIDNKDDINYFASSQMRKVAFGKMLGDFDENGLYVIKEKIVEELIKMPKVIVEILDNADLIRSKVKADAFFHFIIDIEDNKATFKLLEKIPYQSNRDFNTGLYSNINEYVLDQVIIPDKDFNRNALYEKYNISTDNDGDVLSIFDMDELSLALYYNIIEKLKIDYLVQNELMLKEKELEKIEADYFEEILGVLNEFAEFGIKVKTSVKQDLAEKHNFVIISKPFFQQTINEIVDNYIDFYLQDLLPEQREKIIDRIREIKASYYQKFKTLLPIRIEQNAGVRFNANQIITEGIIGGLAQEIETKGFTSSDVRKILINDDELSLSISKIREMVRENEEICKRDNTKVKDITDNRPLTTEFYDELEKDNKVDILGPEKLIEAVIEEKTEKQSQDKKKETIISSIASSAGNKASQTTKPTKDVKNAKGNSVKNAKGDTKSANGGKSSKATKQTKSDGKTATKENASNDSFDFLIGSGGKSDEKDEAAVLDDIVETALQADSYRETSKSGADEHEIEDSINIR